MNIRTSFRTSLAGGAAAALLVAGCAGSQEKTGLDGCTPERLETVAAGRLTLATGAVTRAPWVVGAEAGKSPDPRGGRGYDAAVGHELARRLGFTADDITWVGVAFTTAIAAGEKSFDIDVNQVTSTAERREDVDLSEPYYVMRQAVVTLKDRAVARAERLADLKSVAFATVAGSPAEAVLAEQVRPTVPGVAYPELDDVRGAVSSGTKEAMVVDFRTAMQLDLDERQLVDGDLVGVLPRGEAPAEEYALVLEKDSPLTDCVNAALAAMRADGALDRLERRWLLDEPGYRLLD